MMEINDTDEKHICRPSANSNYVIKCKKCTSYVVTKLLINIETKTRKSSFAEGSPFDIHNKEVSNKINSI